MSGAGQGVAVCCINDAALSAKGCESFAERGRTDTAESAQLLGRQGVIGLCQGLNNAFGCGKLLWFRVCDLVEDTEGKGIVPTSQINRDVVL